jgi:hypothetical protein
MPEPPSPAFAQVGERAYLSGAGGRTGYLVARQGLAAGATNSGTLLGLLFVGAYETYNGSRAICPGTEDNHQEFYSSPTVPLASIAGYRGVQVR